MNAEIYNSPFIDYNNSQFHFHLTELNEMREVLNSILANKIATITESFNFTVVDDTTAVMTVAQTPYPLLLKATYIVTIPQPNEDVDDTIKYWFISDVSVNNGNKVVYNLKLDVYATYAFVLNECNPYVDIRRCHCDRYRLAQSPNRNYFADISQSSFIHTKEAINTTKPIIGPVHDCSIPNVTDTTMQQYLNDNFVGWVVVEYEEAGENAKSDNLVYQSPVDYGRYYKYFPGGYAGPRGLRTPFRVFIAPLGINMKVRLLGNNFQKYEIEIPDGEVLYNKYSSGSSTVQVYNIYVTTAPLVLSRTDRLEMTTITTVTGEVEPAILYDASIIEEMKPGDSQYAVAGDILPHTDGDEFYVYLLTKSGLENRTGILYYNLFTDDESDLKAYPDIVGQVGSKSITMLRERKDLKTFAQPTMSFNIQRGLDNKIFSTGLYEALNNTLGGTLVGVYEYSTFGGGEVTYFAQPISDFYTTYNTDTAIGLKGGSNYSLPVIDDSYKSYLRQAQASNNMNSIGKAIMGVLGGGISAGSGLLSGNLGGVVSGGSGMLSSIAKSTLDLTVAEKQARDADDKASNTAPSVISQYIQGINLHTKAFMTMASERDLQQVDDIYYKYGYNVNESLYYQDLFSRCLFNYVECSDYGLATAIGEYTSANQRKELMDMFSKGVTLLEWRNLVKAGFTKPCDFYGRMANYEKKLCSDSE